MSTHLDAYQALCDHARQTAVLGAIESLLAWDERTMLPAAGGAYRAEQVSLLSGMIHRRRTDERVGQWLEQLVASPLAADPHCDTGATIRELKRDYDKRVKLPQRLVEELARVAVLGQQAWAEARKRDDFASFAPLLDRIVQLKIEQAEAVGYANCRYDALLDDFEPGETTANVRRVLTALREELVPLVEQIQASDRRPNTGILRRQFPVGRQRDLVRRAAALVGFEFQRGRLDETDHPFCQEMGPDDCRITTRYDPSYLPTALFGTLHEAGHGIYQQGLRRDHFGLPPGSYVSLGIHESQSRLWENFVGRSRAFWCHFLPLAQEAFPAALGNVSLDEIYFAVNDVEPSLIRIEADEATYNLHVIVRFELEQALVDGELKVAELPGAWRDKYQEYLGVIAPNDADGVLQDIHWSAGLFGYFPTYSLGNLYAGQLFARARTDLPDLERQFEAGEFGALLNWLRQQVHEPGQCYRPSELVQRVTGSPLSHRPLIDHLRGKYGPLFGLAQTA